MHIANMVIKKEKVVSGYTKSVEEQKLLPVFCPWLLVDLVLL